MRTPSELVAAWRPPWRPALPTVSRDPPRLSAGSSSQSSSRLQQSTPVDALPFASGSPVPLAAIGRRNGDDVIPQLLSRIKCKRHSLVRGQFGVRLTAAEVAFALFRPASRMVPAGLFAKVVFDAQSTPQRGHRAPPRGRARSALAAWALLTHIDPAMADNGRAPVLRRTKSTTERLVAHLLEKLGDLVS